MLVYFIYMSHGYVLLCVICVRVCVRMCCMCVHVCVYMCACFFATISSVSHLFTSLILIYFHFLSSEFPCAFFPGKYPSWKGNFPCHAMVMSDHFRKNVLTSV